MDEHAHAHAHTHTHTDALGLVGVARVCIQARGHDGFS